MTYPDQQRRVLVVDDNVQSARSLADFLSLHEFDVVIHGRGSDAAAHILVEQPDAVLIESNLPRTPGTAICQKIRAHYAGIVIMIGDDDSDVDEVTCLELGADDYLYKPVRMKAMLARLRVRLNSVRHDHSLMRPIVVGALKILPAKRTVLFRGNAVPLTTAEFELLLRLARNPGKTVDRSDLYPTLTRAEYDGRNRGADGLVSRLRRKLGDDPVRPAIIATVRGKGYRLEVPC